MVIKCLRRVAFVWTLKYSSRCGAALPLFAAIAAAAKQNLHFANCRVQNETQTKPRAKTDLSQNGYGVNIHWGKNGILSWGHLFIHSIRFDDFRLRASFTSIRDDSI